MVDAGRQAEAFKTRNLQDRVLMFGKEMIRRLLLGTFLFLPTIASGQGVMVPPRSVLGTVNGVTRPIAAATITVCAANVAGLPCSPALSNAIFRDAALTQPLTNPFTTDANGNYQFGIAAGNYTVTETASGFSGYSYQMSATCSPVGGCTFSGPVAATTLSASGPAALNGGLITTTTTSTGAGIHSGIETFANTNAVVYVDGNVRPCTAAGILAAEAVVAAYGGLGGIVDASACNSFTVPIASTVDVGCVSGDAGCSSTYAVNLRLNSRAIWQGTMTNGTPVFRVHSNSSISCPGMFSSNFCSINIAAAATVSSIVQQGDGTHLSTGVKLDGIEIRNDLGGTVNTALLDLGGAFDSRYAIAVDQMNGKGVYIHDLSVSIGVGELSFDYLALSGNYTAGAVPLDIENNLGGFMGGIHVLTGDFGHPGPGKNLINIDGHGHGGLMGVDISVQYMESSNTDTTTPVINIRDARQVAITTKQINILANASTAACVSISESAPNLTDAIFVPWLYCAHPSGTNNIIVNTVPGAGTGTQVRDTIGPYVFISSERNAAAIELGNFLETSGAIFMGPTGTACTNGVIAEVCGPGASAVGFGVEQFGVGKWRLGMAASSSNLCFGQNDAETTCPFALSTSGVVNTTGLQLFNTTTTCTTGASVGAICTTGAITLPVAYADTNYRLSCTGQGATNVPVVQTYAKSNTTFTITIAALTAAAGTFTSYDCSAVHN